MANDSLAPVSEFTMARRWFIPPTDAPPRFDLITHSGVSSGGFKEFAYRCGSVDFCTNFLSSLSLADI